MMKITGIIILILATIAAIFCLIFKVKVTSPEGNKKTMKARFLVAVSVVMTFFISFFSSSCGSDNNIVRPTSTPSAIPTPLCYTPTPTYNPTPLCYIVAPTYSPTPLCYTPTPSLNPTPLCYTPTPSSTSDTNSYKKEKDILYLRLSLVEELSGKNTIKDDVIKIAKANILKRIEMLEEKES